MSNTSIRTKILAGVVIVNLLGALCVVVYLHQSYSGGLDVAAQKSVDLSLATWDGVTDLQTRKLQASARVAAADAEWQQLLAAGNRDVLYASTKPIFEQLKKEDGITQWYFEKADGTVVLRVHMPEQFGDKVEHTTFQKARKSGTAGGGLDLGKTGLTLRAVVPCLSKSGQKVGYTELAQEVDGFLTLLKKRTGADYGLLIDKSRMDAEAYAEMRDDQDLTDNWDEREGYVLLAATDDGLAEKMQFKSGPDAVPEVGRVVGIENGACSKACHGSVEGEGEYWGVSWSSDSLSRTHVIFPVTDVNGEAIGLVYGIDNISAQADAAKASMMRTLMVIAFTLLIATVLIGGLLDTLVFRRLTAMMGSMQDLSVRVAGGDFDARFQPDGTGDEIGRFEAFFANFIDLVTGTLKAVTGEKSGKARKGA